MVTSTDFFDQVCSSGGYGGYHKREAEDEDGGIEKREASRGYGRKPSCKRVSK